MTKLLYTAANPKKFISLILIVISLFFNVRIQAQTNKEVENLYNEAKVQFANKNYTGTIKSCNKILKLEPEFKDAHLLLADVYNKQDSVDLEIQQLNKAGEIGREWDVVFRLGEAYYKKSDYSEALRYYNIYSDYKAIPEKRQFLLACKMASCKFSIHTIYNPGEFELSKSAKVDNLPSDEYWPITSDDGKILMFTRLPNEAGQKTTDNYYMAKRDTTSWYISKQVNDSNTVDNEGVQISSANSKILFFSACNRPDGLGNCDIYLMRFANGKWSDPVNAGSPVNSEAWEAQPSFSSDGRFLYFSSDRSGGFGKKDIWKAELTGFSDDGLPKWKQPVNMGSVINTSGDEISPFIHPKNQTLYFASNVHASMGGLDLFAADIDGFGNASNLRNLGYPINTNKDELGLTISFISGITYFSAARIADSGLEIFAYNLDMGLNAPPVSYVKVHVTDVKSRKSLVAEVKLENQNMKSGQSQLLETDEKGDVMSCLQINRNYTFNVSEPGYLYYSKSIQPTEKNTIQDPTTFNIELQPIEIGAEVQLYNIYYETDSFRILPQSEPELQNLVAFLKNNNVLKIEIQGHTDSSGNAENNKLLSERRAKSVVDYLVKNGIKTARLKFGGYGDKVPIASNETPEGRKMNRRTTIKILEK